MTIFNTVDYKLLTSNFTNKEQNDPLVKSHMALIEFLINTGLATKLTKNLSFDDLSDNANFIMQNQDEYDLDEINYRDILTISIIDEVFFRLKNIIIDLKHDLPHQELIDSERKSYLLEVYGVVKEVIETNEPEKIREVEILKKRLDNFLEDVTILDMDLVINEIEKSIYYSLERNILNNIVYTKLFLNYDKETVLRVITETDDILHNNKNTL